MVLDFKVNRRLVVETTINFFLYLFVWCVWGHAEVAYLLHHVGHDRLQII